MTILDSYLAELVKATLENRKSAKVPTEVSVKEIIEIADLNQMRYLLLNPLVKEDISAEDKKEIQVRIKYSMLISGVQMFEYNLLANALEQNEVMYQPMKGIVMKKIYPTQFMREMGDVDLLIEESCKEKSQKVFSKLGYELNQSIHHHDVYRKRPHLVVEAHHARYDKTVDKNQYQYYKNFSKAVKDEASEYRYRFTKEDFYVYMMAHMAKHFYQMGCGIRNLVDIYVYRKQYAGILDEAYIDRELQILGIDCFTKHMEKLTDIWLDGEETTLFYDNLFSYMLKSGLYGRDENGIWNEFAREKDESPEGYRKRLHKFYQFPPYHYMVKYHPWLEGKRILLPVAWVGRLIYINISKKGDKKLKMLHDISDLDVKIIQEIYCKMQFDFRA